MKEDQSVLLMCLKAREERVKELEERVKELEERDVILEEDDEENSKEIIVTLQNNYIETVDKAIQTQSVDTNVSNQACTYCRFIFHLPLMQLQLTCIPGS